MCKFFVGVIVSEKFSLRKCVFVVFKFVLHGKQITYQADLGNNLKHAQLLQGVPVWHPPHRQALINLAVFHPIPLACLARELLSTQDKLVYNKHHTY